MDFATLGKSEESRDIYDSIQKFAAWVQASRDFRERAARVPFSLNELRLYTLVEMESISRQSVRAVFPSKISMANRLGIHKPELLNALKSLEEKKVIWVKERGGDQLEVRLNAAFGEWRVEETISEADWVAARARVKHDLDPEFDIPDTQKDLAEEMLDESLEGLLEKRPLEIPTLPPKDRPLEIPTVGNSYGREFLPPLEIPTVGTPKQLVQAPPPLEIPTPGRIESLERDRELSSGMGERIKGEGGACANLRLRLFRYLTPGDVRKYGNYWTSAIEVDYRAVEEIVRDHENDPKQHNVANPGGLFFRKFEKIRRAKATNPATRSVSQPIRSQSPDAPGPMPGTPEYDRFKSEHLS